MPALAAALIELLTAAIAQWAKEYTTEAERPHDEAPKRLPYIGEMWELIKSGPQQRPTMVIITDVRDGFVLYHYERTPEFVNCQPIGYFVGIYKVTSAV